MENLILVFIIVAIVVILSSTNLILKNTERVEGKYKTLAKNMLKVITIAPIIALIILLLVIHFYLKTHFAIRLSHAWIVLQLWIFTTLLYVITMIIRNINKKFMIFTAAAMMLSVWIAIYLTPLPHYENLVNGYGIIILNIFGFAMLGIVYASSTLLLKKLNKVQ